jgi:hypothetical protein
VAETRAPETLAERFWSLARGMERDGESTEPIAVVAHVLAVLDALAAGQRGGDLTVNTVSFLALLRQHEVQGDLLYASPEQARGEEVDERSLVFSVGVLLFEKLTGRHPFGAEGNPQRVARIRRGEMASGVNYFPKVPAELRTVLVKAMGPFPEERYASLSELRGELEQYVDRAKNPQKYERVRERERAARATLPALPDLPSRDDEQTRLHLKRAPEAPRPARTTGRVEAVVAEPRQAAAVEAAPATAIAEPRVERPRYTEPPIRRRSMPPVAWMALGAGLTAAAFLVLGGGEPARDPAPAAASRSAAPVATSPPAPPVATSLAAAEPAAEPAASSPAPAPAASPPSGPAASPPSGPTASPPSGPVASSPSEPAAPPTGVFDAEVGGRSALAAVRVCVGADRKVQFGASLLYKPDGRSSKIYYGNAQQLTPPEVRCLARTLLGLEAGGRPPVTTPINYQFRLGPGGDEVKSRIETPR